MSKAYQYILNKSAWFSLQNRNRIKFRC